MNIDSVKRILESYVNNDAEALGKAVSDLARSENRQGHIQNAKIIKSYLSKIPNASKMDLGRSSVFPTKPHKVISMDNSNPLYEVINSSIQLESVVLEDESKHVVSTFLREWENADKLLAHNTLPTNTLLFYGEPGTGKTKLAYGLANKLDIPLVLVRLDEIISSFLGKTGKNIREIFEFAKSKRSIIFLDEIDTLAKHRDDSKELGELKRVVTVLLQNIDEFPSNSILIGATNHESLLDKAIWRRFQVKLNLASPSLKSRESLFELYLEDYFDTKQVRLLSRITEGLNGSAIRDMSEHMKKSAILKGKTKLDLEEIVDSYKYLYKEKANRKSTKIKLYELCRHLRNGGYSLTEISELSGLPVSTLSDNIK